MMDVSEETAHIDEDVSKAMQGKVVGVIIPPPDIRAVVDKTAQFVARNGKSFEQRILGSGEGKTAKFNFMKQFDPYHAYYEQKIREFEEGKTLESKSDSKAVEETKQVEVAVPATVSVSTSAKASITTPIARFAMNKSSSAPPRFEFSMGHPSGLSAVDVDIIKLTAQYTAANGRDFLGGIALREQRNPQFDFLKPTHMLFSYFTSLVDAYAKVLQPSNEQLACIKAKKNRMTALESAVHRWDWNRTEEERKKKESVQADEERSAFQSIDWFDFTVVETIDFADDELYELPSMAANGSGALMPVAEDEDMDMDTDMDMEDEQDNGVSGQHMAMPPPPIGSIPPPPTGSSSGAQSSSSLKAVEVNDIEVDEEYSVDVDMEADSDLNIVTDYTPRIASSSAGPMTMIDPISGKIIPVDEMSEHMRVQLMDPRWRIEQKRFQDKQRETGYAEGGSIADSLKTFAKMRGDIFGRKEPNSAESQEEKKETVQWDGHMASIPQMQQLKNEIAARAPQPVVTAASALPAIGPTIPGLGPQIPRPPAPIVQSVPAPPPSALPPPLPTPPSAPMPAPIVAAPVVPPQIPQPLVSIPVVSAPPAAPIPAAPIVEVQANVTIEEDTEPEAPVVKRARTTPAPAPPVFAAQYPDPISINCVTPVDSSTAAWGLEGQTVSVTVSVTCNIKTLKEMLTSVLGGMPGNKQQLKALTGGSFFKDNQTLASLNLGGGSTIELVCKTRGGGKK